MAQYDDNKYRGLLIQGKLHDAFAYLEEFPEMAFLAKKIQERFSKEQYSKRTNNPVIDRIDRAYQQYYKDIFWNNCNGQDCLSHLYKNLLTVLTEQEVKVPIFIKKEDAENEYEQKIDELEEILSGVVEREGFHFLGGTTQGYYGPYIWKTTTKEEYMVELPLAVQKYHIFMMDGFVSRSWLDYLSMGESGAGGWQKEEGLYCVRSCYEKQMNQEVFTVTFLKHEAQHDYDKKVDPGISAVMLEYRAKLVELIYSSTIERFKFFLASASSEDPSNSHTYADYLVIKNLSNKIFHKEYVSEISLWEAKLEQIQKYSRVCYEESYDQKEGK